MTKRSIQEVDQELNKVSRDQTKLYNDSMYYRDGRWWWRDTSAISEINRMTRRIHRLHYERNQAWFRDWSNHINKHSIL